MKDPGNEVAANQSTSQSEKASLDKYHNAPGDPSVHRFPSCFLRTSRFAVQFEVVKAIEIPHLFSPSFSHFAMIRKHTEAFWNLRGFRLRGKLIILLKAFRSFLSRRRQSTDIHYG